MSQPPQTKIFLNYRREDTAGHAGRLYDDLAEHFGADRVFMDIDKIEPGLDFAESIERALDSCDVVLAVIGRHWLTIADGTGARRLDSPDDYVRMELEAALARGVRVIPVRVQGSEMPSRAQLPPSLAPLARRQAVELSDSRWRYDVSSLASALERLAAEIAARTDREQSGADGQSKREQSEAHEAETTAGGDAVVVAGRSHRRRLAFGGGAIVLALVGAAVAFAVLKGTEDNGGVVRTVVETQPIVPPPAALPPAPPPAPPPATETVTTILDAENVSLIERFVRPGAPYRCVTPFHRDHSGEMELRLEYADGSGRTYSSRGPSDKSDDFLFCGGTRTYGIGGLASAPIRFEGVRRDRSVTSISGVFGADFDSGSQRRRIALTTSVGDRGICFSETDAAGHAEKFSCELPPGTRLEDVVLRLAVDRDAEFGVFAGIADLRGRLVS